MVLKTARTTEQEGVVECRVLSFSYAEVERSFPDIEPRE